MWIISSHLCPDLPCCLFHLPHRYFCERDCQSTSLRPELAQENVFRDFGVRYRVEFCVSTFQRSPLPPLAGWSWDILDYIEYSACMTVCTGS